MKKADKQHSLSKSDFIAKMPLACSDETAAVEFLEAQRWGETPACVKCGSVEVYKMADAKTGERSKRYLWRCRDCKEQYTVRIGTVYEESRIPLKTWCFAFWRAATSKKGVSALEISRQCQISYKSALFLMNRIRFAMAPDAAAPKLAGEIEADELYVGGKPRWGKDYGSLGRSNKRLKTPVFCAVERSGQKRSRVVADVTGKTLKTAIQELVDQQSRVMTDENPAYVGLRARFEGGHETVRHTIKEYARGDVNTNTVESSFALVRRGIHGIYHNVSREHLQRYLWQFDFLWNGRTLNDGERTIAVIKGSEGKRLMYKQPA